MAESDLLSLTAKIVSAHVAHNEIDTDKLAGLITSVYATLANVGTVEPEAAKQEPAVNPKRSVFPDYLVCLEDGKKLKMLRRHLSASYNLTPAEYRAKWGLPSDYPMVSPNYAKTRSALAISLGLGRKPAAPAPAFATEPPVKKIAEGVSANGRKKKAA